MQPLPPRGLVLEQGLAGTPGISDAQKEPTASPSSLSGGGPAPPNIWNLLALSVCGVGVVRGNRQEGRLCALFSVKIKAKPEANELLI